MTSKLSQQQIETLRQNCLKALNLSYSPYSNFSVGAALLLSSGEAVLGANVENASYGATVCAERVALLKCLTSEDPFLRDVSNWVALGVMSRNRDKDKSKTGTIVSPCGICRQVLAEFVKNGDDDDNKFVVVMFGGDDDLGSQIEIRSVGELLPMRFELQ